MGAKKPQLLIVDGSPANMESLHELLGPEYELVFADSSQRALELALNETPDLVLLDGNHPEAGGFDACSSFKADKRTENIPVLYITPEPEEERDSEALDAGATDLLSKPYHRSIVRQRVQNYLELKRQRDLLHAHDLLDGLTGIANRRRFEQSINQEWRRGLRSRAPLSLVILDVDCLSAYNEALGHLAGDECLRKIAHSLEGSMYRAGDVVARFDGGQFAAVLPETDQIGGYTVAQRLQQLMNAAAMPHPRSTVSKCVTFSMGVATKTPTFREDHGTLVQAALQAVVQAKQEGRNRIVGWNTAQYEP